MPVVLCCAVCADDSFLSFQRSFVRAHACSFDPSSEENPLAYHAIFLEYSSSLEAFMLAYLTAALPGFSLERLSRVTAAYANANAQPGICDDEGEGECPPWYEQSDVLELIASLTDFHVFRDWMMNQALHCTTPTRTRAQQQQPLAPPHSHPHAQTANKVAGGGVEGFALTVTSLNKLRK